MKFGIVYKKDFKGKSFLRSSSFDKLRTAGLKEENREARNLVDKVEKYLKSKSHQVLRSDFKGADYILTFGGDGTLIHTACEHIELDVPFIGINTGNLGFLTAIESNQWEKAIDNLILGKVFISERITIEAQVIGSKEVFRAINEAAIKSYYRMSELEILIEDMRFLKVLGDGVIIATQTGSTAYSLSAGGPIVDPAHNSLLITPINPIGLPIPSVVLAPDSSVKIKVTNGKDISLVLDGQEHTKLKVSDVVLIKKGKHPVKFGYFDKDHFAKSLNVKFGLTSRTVK